MPWSGADGSPGPASGVKGRGHPSRDYNRGKWGKIAKAGLWAGEWLSGKYSHEMIAISKLIRDIIQKRCNRIKTDQKLVIAGLFVLPSYKAFDFIA